MYIYIFLYIYIYIYIYIILNSNRFQMIVSVINPYLFDFCRIIFKQQKLETKKFMRILDNS